MGDIIAYTIVSLIVIGLVTLIIGMLVSDKRKQKMDYKIERTKTIIVMVDVRIGMVPRTEKNKYVATKYRFYELRLEQIRGRSDRALRKELNNVMDAILIFEELIINR